MSLFELINGAGEDISRKISGLIQLEAFSNPINGGNFAKGPGISVDAQRVNDKVSGVDVRVKGTDEEFGYLSRSLEERASNGGWSKFSCKGDAGKEYTMYSGDGVTIAMDYDFKIAKVSKPIEKHCIGGFDKAYRSIMGLVVGMIDPAQYKAGQAAKKNIARVNKTIGEYSREFLGKAYNMTLLGKAYNGIAWIGRGLRDACKSAKESVKGMFGPKEYGTRQAARERGAVQQNVRRVPRRQAATVQRAPKPAAAPVKEYRPDIAEPERGSGVYTDEDDRKYFSVRNGGGNVSEVVVTEITYANKLSTDQVNKLLKKDGLGGKYDINNGVPGKLFITPKHQTNEVDLNNECVSIVASLEGAGKALKQ